MPDGTPRAGSSVGPGSRAAVVRQAAAALSWTSEGADASFVCDRERKAAANKRQPQRAERAIDTASLASEAIKIGSRAAVLRTRSRHASSSASEDEVGGCQARSALSELGERSNLTS